MRGEPDAGEARGDEPIINIRGELVALGPLRRDLLPLYQRWINDPETMRGIGEHLPMTAEQEEAWYDDQKRRENINFTVYELSTLRPIGNTSLQQMDHLHGTAEFGIFLGEADARGVAGEFSHDRGGEAAVSGSVFQDQPDTLIGEAGLDGAALLDRAEEGAFGDG